MNFKLSSLKITGSPKEGGWSQVHEFAPSDSDRLKKRGHLFAVFATNTEKEGVESVSAGRELLTRLHEEYFGQLEPKAFNALKDSVGKVANEFGRIWGNVEIAAVSVVDNVVYSAASGGAQIVILRDGMFATILESKKDQTVSASGYPQRKDTLIIATQQFVENVPRGSLKAALERENFESTKELIAPIAASVPASSRLSAVFVRFEDKSPKDRVFMRGVKVLNRHENLEGEAKTGIGVKPKNILSNFVKRLPDRKIYIRKKPQDEESERKRKLTVSVGVILLLILIVSIVFGFMQKTKKEERERYQEILSQAQHEYDEALEVYSLNPQRARELIVESRKKVNQLTSEGVGDVEVDDLKNNLETSVEAILGEYRPETDLFLDLTLLSEGFSGDSLTTSDEVLYVLDKESERVVSIAVDTKRSEVKAGPSQIDEPKDIATYSDRVFILEKDGIYEVGNNKEKRVDQGWGDDVLVYAYTGNLYVLDKQASDILRFSGTGSDFSKGTSWLAAGQNLDFSDIISWVIDGSIWMTNSSGKIMRFSLGNFTSFSIEGLYPELTSARAIYTNENLKYFYVLDNDGKRMVVLTKGGEYKAQYISDEIGNAINFAVSEEERKAILLTGEKLLSIELRHL